jgi:hypothetical protein
MIIGSHHGGLEAVDITFCVFTIFAYPFRTGNMRVKNYVRCAVSLISALQLSLFISDRTEVFSSIGMGLWVMWFDEARWDFWWNWIEKEEWSE